MPLTITLPPETERRLNAVAAEEATDPAVLVADIVVTALSNRESDEPDAGADIATALAEYRDEAANGDPGLLWSDAVQHIKRSLARTGETNTQ
jgi:hypothetical protein